MPRNDFMDEERPYGKRSSQRYSKNPREDDCPYCEEGRFYKDHRDCREKPCFPPCPEWFMCPPPWWCKPEQEEKKDCRRKEKDDCDCRRREKDDCDCRRKDRDDCDCHRKEKDDCDCRRREKDDCDCHRKDDCDCHKKDDCDKCERGCDIEAFAYVYSLTATPVTVLTNNDVVFTNNGPMDCVTHTPNTSQVFIKKSGVYNVFYAVNTTLGAGATISLAVNGAIDPATTIPIQIAASNTAGDAIVRLRAGDFLTLRNSSAVSITLATAPNVGAQLKLFRLDEIEHCNF